MVPCTAITPSPASVGLFSTIYLIWWFRPEICMSQIGGMHFVQTICVATEAFGIKIPVGRLLRPAVRLQGS